MNNTRYDVAIIGSGLAGSSLAAILARQGLQVIIFEAKSHPRFSIGESLILETSELMRALAHFFDVPELAYFSTENFAPFLGTTHGVKRHFGFLYHTPGREHNPRHTLQAIIPKEPHGHELHLYRQDTDYFLTMTAVAYGATLWQNKPVKEVIFSADGLTVVTGSGEMVRANYVVDAGGYKSVLADQFKLRDHHLQTHSRAIFNHLVNVPGYEQVGHPSTDYGLPYRMSEGTLHHVFDGGWLWVIPFDNHPQSTNPLCSVGLLLDPRQHPPCSDLTAEEEFLAFIAQFPTVAAQFAAARPVREWTRTGRIQYTSTQVVGDRWALLGHAAGFIDPLYSKGLYVTLMGVGLLAHLLLQAQQMGDFSAQAFAPLERATKNFISNNDRLVANSFRAFGHYDLWQVYAVMWLLGAYTELVKLNMIRAQTGHDRQAYFGELAQLKLVGGGFGEFEQISGRVDGLMEQVNPANEIAVAQTVADIKQIFRAVEWLPQPFLALLDGKTYLPKNKLRLSLLNPNEGFMGKGEYRQHFFGKMSLADLLAYGLREKIHYSRLYLTWQHTQHYRKRVKS